MIVPNIYFPVAIGVEVLLNAAAVVILAISVTRKMSLGLLLLCLGSSVYVATGLSTWITVVCKALGSAHEHRELLLNLYFVNTVLQPISDCLIFAGIVVLAFQNLRQARMASALNS